jgi:prepilin-type N-terminal cleavage/methylation domain-containing protein
MRRSAFSLVELTMVIAIVGVAAAIAMPRYSASLARYKLEAAARRLAADLALAQSRARALSASQTVIFSAAGYTLSGMTDPERPSSPYSVSLGEEFSASITANSFGHGKTVTFNGYGVPDGAGTIILQVGVLQKSVSVDADTGVASIQ